MEGFFQYQWNEDPPPPDNNRIWFGVILICVSVAILVLTQIDLT